MKKTKKALALLLAATMTLSLAACGKDAKETTEPAADEVVTEEVSADVAAEEVTEVAEEAGYPAVDLGGRTIKIGIWWDEFWDSEYLSLIHI